MFNAIVEEEEENSEIEVDDDKSKELKEKLAQSIEDFSSELKETLTQSLKDISNEAQEKEVKKKKPIWSMGLFGITFSVSLLFSAIMSIFVYLMLFWVFSQEVFWEKAKEETNFTTMYSLKRF